MTDAEIRAWLVRDGVPRVILVEIDFMYQVAAGSPLDAVPTLDTVYLANMAYVDAVNGQPYVDCIVSIPNFQRSLDRATLLGRYSANVGSIEIDNASGEFDYLLYLALDGSEVRVYIGDETWLRSDFVMLYSAVSGRARAPSPDRVSIETRDASLLLNKSIGGMVEVGGTGPSAGRFRPLNFGYVHQLEPISYDAVTLIYVHSDTGTDAAVQDVRNNGVSVTFTDNTDGTFTLDVPPAGNEQITCDVLVTNAGGVGSPPSSVAYRASDALAYLIGDRAGLTASGRYIGPAGFEVGGFVGGFNDYHVGISIPEKRNVIDIAGELVETFNGFWAFNREGEFFYKTMRPEALPELVAAGAPIITIIQLDDIIEGSFKLDHNPPTFASYQPYGNINWITQSQFATSLDAADKEQYTRKGFYPPAYFGEEPGTTSYLGAGVSFRGGAPELYHLSLSDSQAVSTLISGPDDTTVIDLAATPPQSVDNYLGNWVSIRRSKNLPWLEFIDITVGLDFYDLELGDIVTLIVPRFDLDAGELHQICSVNIDATSAQVQLGLVRRRYADVDSLYDPSLLLMEDSGFVLQESDHGITL